MADTKKPKPARPPRAEVHIFGHVMGARLTTSSLGVAAHAMGMSTSAAHCSYRLVAGPGWSLGRGAAAGASHTDCSASEPGAFVWSQPFDASFVGTALDGWPRIEVEVRSVDAHGRSELAGYATHHVPAAPGTHSICCRLWRPRGSFVDRLSTYFLGAPPQLKDPTLVYGSPGADRSLSRSNGRDRITSVSEGEVYISLSVVTRELPPVEDAEEQADPNDPAAVTAARAA